MSSSSAPPTSKTILVKTSDNKIFVVEEDVAMESPTIKRMMEENGDADAVIDLPEVKSDILGMILTYCRKRKRINRSEENLKAYEILLINVDTQDTLPRLILASHYLDISYLRDLMCKVMADIFNNNNVAGIREALGIKNNLTPEEEEELRMEMALLCAEDDILLT